MEKCPHGCYIPDRLIEYGVSDGCTVCQSQASNLDGHYGKIAPLNIVLPSNLSDLYEVWVNTGLEEAYQKIFYSIRSYALSIGSSRFAGRDDIPTDWHDEAIDAASDTLLNIKKFDEDKSRLSTWVHVCINNHMTNWLEREVEFHQTIDDDENPVDKADGRSLQDEKLFVKEVKALLSTDELELFEMKADNLSFKTIGDRLGVSEVTAFRHWNKLAEKIRLMSTIS